MVSKLRAAFWGAANAATEAYENTKAWAQDFLSKANEIGLELVSGLMPDSASSQYAFAMNSFPGQTPEAFK